MSSPPTYKFPGFRKNGDQDARKRYQAVQSLFRTFTGCDFDVGIDSPISSVPSTPDETPTIELALQVVTPFGDIPIAFSGAGIGEALFLSPLIEGTENCVVMLDEPAHNLHPTTQARVVKEIARRGQSQFIVVTHSPLMVPGDAIEKVPRFFLRDGETSRAAPDWKTLGRKRTTALRQEFGGTSDVRPLLYQSRDHPRRRSGRTRLFTSLV
jgi:hypothetical protein